MVIIIAVWYSFIHWGDISLILLFILSVSCMNGSIIWTAVFYLTIIAIIGMGIWHMAKYGFLWGLGVWFYNILIVALVISIINAISNAMKKDKK